MVEGEPLTTLNPELRTLNLELNCGAGGAAAGGKIGADGGQSAAGRDRQRKKFIHDAQNQFHPVGYCQLVIQALTVRVDGVGRDVEIVGNGEFGAIVEHPAHNLKFLSREFQAAGDFSPRLLGEHGSA